MSRKKELKTIIDVAYDELEAIEQKERVDKAKSLIGKFYKYRNRYGNSESWDLFIKVNSFDNNGNVHGFRFEIDCNEEINIQFNTPLSLSDSCTEITEEEFNKAWSQLQARIASFC